MKSLMLLGRKMEEEKVKLGIGIGVESYVVGSGGGMFTARQLHELEQQAVIYKYLAARVPVPFHLVAPIWESVAVSLRPCKSVTPFNHLDYRDQMDPEPGRCRRTDGKKWRCGRNVIPQHKYCEQHMHRGRGRSRKPVENSEVASPTSAKKPKHSEGESWNSKTSIQISPPKSLLRTRKSSLTSLSQGASTAASGHHECNKSITSATTASIGHIPPARETATSRAALPTATVAGPTTGHNSHSTQFNLNIGPGDNISNHGAKNCMIRESSNTRNSMNIGSNASPGLGFSPRSVLQGSNGNKSGEELEPVRCRKTDGMKSQCKREVLPVEKYCSQHTARGVKREAKDFKPVAVPSTLAATTKSTRLSQTMPKSSFTSLIQSATTASNGHHECNKSKTSVTTTSISYIPPARETTTSCAAVPTASVAGPTSGNNSHSTQINLSIGLGDNISNHGAKNCMIRGSSNTRNSLNVGSNASPGLGFSPKSVLQDLLGSNGINLGNKSGEELEPGRCRKTDGMKWQYLREVPSDEKHCIQHTRRGAKRQAKDFKPVAVPSTSAATVNSTRLSQTTPKSRKTERAVPSTNLSISIPASSSLIQNDENSDSGSDSDATITDTSLAAYDGGYVSS